MRRWKPITPTDPPEGAEVLTRIDDSRGVRNEQRLKRKGRLWFLPDMSMYVYYEPTEYLIGSETPPGSVPGDVRPGETAGAVLP